MRRECGMRARIGWYRYIKCLGALFCILLAGSLILDTSVLDLEEAVVQELNERPKEGWNYEEMPAPTMKTIIAYSAEKKAEMEKKYPISCDSRPPAPLQIDGNTARWQHVAGSDVSLYSGYYDDRMTGRPYLRILSMVKGRKLSLTSPLYCQTRVSTDAGSNIESVEVTSSEIWWDEWDKLSYDVETPLLFSCPLTSTMNETFFVSVVLNPCDNPSNILKIDVSNAMKTHTSNFTLCVKDMSFGADKNVSEKIIEWIEFNRIVGADKIDIYVDTVRDDIDKILTYYRRSGLVELLAAPIASANRSLWQRRRDHLISYNDCLYRNLHSSRYIVPVDVDEVIVPRKVMTWSAVVDNVLGDNWDTKRFAALTVRNAFFFDAINEGTCMDDETEYAIDNDTSINEIENTAKRKKPVMLRHLVRSALISPMADYGKSFVSTAYALTVFNHYPLSMLDVGTRWRKIVPLSEAQLNHYKERCQPHLVPECAVYLRRKVRDDIALKFSRNLIAAVGSAKEALRIF